MAHLKNPLKAVSNRRATPVELEQNNWLACARTVVARGETTPDVRVGSSLLTRSTLNFKSRKNRNDKLHMREIKRPRGNVSREILRFWRDGSRCEDYEGALGFQSRGLSTSLELKGGSKIGEEAKSVRGPSATRNKIELGMVVHYGHADFVSISS